MKNISVLGSTGSIGTQTLDVARKHNVKVSAITANKNIKLLEEQAREFKPLLALEMKTSIQTLKLLLLIPISRWNAAVRVY